MPGLKPWRYLRSKRFRVAASQAAILFEANKDVSGTAMGRDVYGGLAARP